MSLEICRAEVSSLSLERGDKQADISSIALSYRYYRKRRWAYEEKQSTHQNRHYQRDML